MKHAKSVIIKARILITNTCRYVRTTVVSIRELMFNGKFSREVVGRATWLMADGRKDAAGSKS